MAIPVHDVNVVQLLRVIDGTFAAELNGDSTITEVKDYIIAHVPLEEPPQDVAYPCTKCGGSGKINDNADFCDQCNGNTKTAGLYARVYACEPTYELQTGE